MFICGSGSFGHQEEDDYESPCTTPKKSKRSTSFCKIICRDNDAKNPYADRGLDKFNELLADLDGKKQQIYTQMGSDHISFVRFVYTNDSKRIKPIIVKVKEKNDQDMKSPRTTITSPTRGTETTQIIAGDVTQVLTRNTEELKDKGSGSSKSLLYSESFRLHGLRQPIYYVPVIVLLILFLLVIFGRSFAIMCTSIFWYLTPLIDGSSTTTSSKKAKPKMSKKDYVKKVSEKKVAHSEGPSSPTSVLNWPNPRNYKNQQFGPIRRSL